MPKQPYQGTKNRIGSGLLITAICVAAVQTSRFIWPELPHVAGQLVLPVIICAYLAGRWTALASACIVVAYALIAWSTPSQLFAYSDDDLVRLIVLAATSLLAAMLVGYLRESSDRSVAALHAEIAHRVRAEAAVAVSEARFRSIAEGAKDAILMVDGSSTILYLNRAAHRMFGLSESEVLGQGLQRFMPKRFRARHQRVMNRLVGMAEAHLSGITVELVGRRADGAEFPVEVSLSTWMAPEGRVFSAIVRDITDRKKANAERSAVLRSMRNILDNSVDMICTIDAQGCFSSVSHASERILGYKPAELIGLPYIDFVHPDDRPASLDIARGIKKTSQPTDFENRYFRKDGSLVFLAWSARWSTSKNIIHCSARDVTERNALLEDKERTIALIGSLASLLPMCSWCHKIRDAEGNWQEVSRYMEMHYDAEVTHSICSTCLAKKYPGA